MTLHVGWIADDPGYVGGAELTQREFRAAAPEGVEIIDCPPGNVTPGLDHYIAHNVCLYSPSDMDAVGDVTWFHHDLSHHIQPGVRERLDAGKHIYCSPLQRDRYGLDGECVPPALNLSAFRPNRQHRRHGKRQGTCSIAQWRNPGKGAHLLAEYAAQNGPVDVYGDGNFFPQGPNINLCGPLDPAAVAPTLWAYETFVFLPFEVEPFCRTVAEAHFAGCSVVTNELIGARHYIENDPDALENAAERFWDVAVGVSV